MQLVMSSRKLSYGHRDEGKEYQILFTNYHIIYYCSRTHLVINKCLIISLEISIYKSLQQLVYIEWHAQNPEFVKVERIYIRPTCTLVFIFCRREKKKWLVVFFCILHKGAWKCVIQYIKKTVVNEKVRSLRINCAIIHANDILVGVDFRGIKMSSCLSKSLMYIVNSMKKLKIHI